MFVCGLGLISWVDLQGFITHDGATGDGSALPLNNPDIQQHQQQQQQQQQQGLGFGSVFNSGSATTGSSSGLSQRPSVGGSAGNPPQKDVFQGSARTLTTRAADQSSSGFHVGRVLMGNSDADSAAARPSHSEVQARRLAALARANPRTEDGAVSPSAPPLVIQSSDVRKIVEMGYSESDARRALEMADGNLQAAMNLLTT